MRSASSLLPGGAAWSLDGAGPHPAGYAPALQAAMGTSPALHARDRVRPLTRARRSFVWGACGVYAPPSERPAARSSICSYGLPPRWRSCVSPSCSHRAAGFSGCSIPATPTCSGTFPYHNNYAQFVELALPVALFGAPSPAAGEPGRMRWQGARSMRRRSDPPPAPARFSQPSSWPQSSSPACGVCEPRGDDETDRNGHAGRRSGDRDFVHFRSWLGKVWQRFSPRAIRDPRRVTDGRHREMAGEEHPWIGFGLDTFPDAYQKYAVKDFACANHAHNDSPRPRRRGRPLPRHFSIPFAMAARKPSATRGASV